MPVDPLQNLILEIMDLKRRLKTLETAPSQQNMTVDKGATRILSDEGLQIGAPGSSNGSAVVYGVLRIIGELIGDGDINWEGLINQLGSTNLRGPVKITGEDGTLEVDAETLLRGLTRMLDDLQVESGGRITIGIGSKQIVIDGATGTITVPGSNPIVLHQDDNGLAKVEFGSTGAIWSGGDGVTIASGSDGAINVYSDGIDLVGDVHIMPPLGPLPSGVSGKYMIIGSDGMIYAGSAGGGGGGDTPPNPFPGGYVWPTDPAIYGISDDYGDHVARGSAEPGTDVAAPVGAAVYAPADGEVRAVSTSMAGATGRLIVFRATNGAWFRFLHLSEVLVTSGAVTQGTILGRTGGSGFGSEAYYGPHLHITYLPGPSATQPALSSSTDFELVMAAQ